MGRKHGWCRETSQDKNKERHSVIQKMALNNIIYNLPFLRAD